MAKIPRMSARCGTFDLLFSKDIDDYFATHPKR